MKTLRCYQISPEWNIDTLPNTFRNQHNTQEGTWAKLEVLAGSLRYESLDEAGNVLDSVIFDAASDIPFIAPQQWHRIAPIDGDLRCRLGFYCRDEDYYQKKYSLSATHSEVIELMQYINGGTALDIGCGRGRNSLFLQKQGFDITGVDHNNNAIENLQEIIAAEKLSHIRATVADVCHFTPPTQYDAVISTVVLMFVDSDKIPALLTMMQNHTKTGGYNLIVSAMDSDDYPLATQRGLLFDFGFKTGELAAYYRDWNIKKYNENIGKLHRRDENGERITLRFATLIAQKI